jgi:hypothetical protein
VANLTFYRQKRYDDGVRMGVELNDWELAHYFEEGKGERDPSLLWYVDLRCDGSGIPDDPDDAAHWLAQHSPSIKEGFARFAEKLKVGADPDLYSLYWNEFPEVPEGVDMKIACSAVRRIEGREMSAILAETGKRWDEFLLMLDIPQSAEGVR